MHYNVSIFYVDVELHKKDAILHIKIHARRLGLNISSYCHNYTLLLSKRSLEFKCTRTITF